MSTKQPETPEDIGALLSQIESATSERDAEATHVPASNIELTSKVVDALFDMSRRKLLGILSKTQIQGIKKLYLINDIIFDNRTSVLTRIIDNEIDLSVSDAGKGREQLVKLTKVDDPIDEKSGFSRFIRQ